MLILEGKVLFIEFKAPGKRPTALQERWLADLRSQGMFATWCDDIGNGRAMVNFFLL
jgi:hypothetical protein